MNKVHLVLYHTLQLMGYNPNTHLLHMTKRTLLWSQIKSRLYMYHKPFHLCIMHNFNVKCYSFSKYHNNLDNALHCKYDKYSHQCIRDNRQCNYHKYFHQCIRDNQQCSLRKYLLMILHSIQPNKKTNKILTRDNNQYRM